MANIWRRTILFVSIATALLAFRTVSWDRPVSTFRISRPLMGTVWNIEVVDEGNPDAAHAAVEQAYTELNRIDFLMSEWKPQSPISQVNAAAGKHPVTVPAELRELIQRAIRYSELTDGAFDITWRGMGNIWKFDDSFVPPKPAAVEAARRNVDYRLIQIKGNSIYLPSDKMSIGLGGIAKGYAVDRAMEVLHKAGFRNAMVDGGGDIRVSGNRRGTPWRVGIQNPRAPRGELLGRVAPVNESLLTSGDYERFRIVDGVRYHHIIDLRTGYPARLATSVSVLAPSAELGVVMAKGVFILGPEKGIALARSQRVEAMLVDANGRQHFTEGFKKALQTE